MTLSARFGAAAFAFGLLAASPVAADGPGCKTVSAIIDTVFSPCASGTCTVGTITGAPGPLRSASTFFVLTGASPAPSNPEGCVVSGFFCITDYTGVLSISTEEGVLDIADSGRVDFVTGEFAETDEIFGGSGEFQDASGALVISGSLKADGSGFVGDVSGTLCRPD